jgi:Glycosyl transferase family 2
MTEAPGEVRELLRQREEARRAKDFVAADRLRDRIRAAGFEVTDGAAGPVLEPRAVAATAVDRPAGLPDRLGEPATMDASVHWIVEGWPQDVARGIAAFDATARDRSVQHVVVDVREASEADDAPWPEHAETLRLPDGIGWGAGRNAGLRASTGAIVIVVDGSIEVTGDVLGPLAQALADPSVGITGPFGITSEDLHDFRESPGPDVDAVEGYLMAFPRSLLEDGLRFDEKFRFYRTADIELSFQVKARGLRAAVTPLPVRRHEHRMWANTPEDERARLSKRNFYRFLDRWRGRTDLLVAPRP